MRIISLLTRKTIILCYSLIFCLIQTLAQVNSGNLGGANTGAAFRSDSATNNNYVGNSNPSTATTIPLSLSLSLQTQTTATTISPASSNDTRRHEWNDTSEHGHMHHLITSVTSETSTYSTTPKTHLATSNTTNTTITSSRTTNGPTNHTNPSTHLSSPIKRQRKICPGIHIRNDLKSFEQLRGCEIIDGPLTIALVSNQTHPFEPKDYENITFPQLTEITEYLLFFRVEGLTSLSGLLPELAVIRGKRLVSNYALIIYEMMHLQKINLPKLTDILEGAVRIENNPNLCYVTTVNWEGICKYVAFSHFIKGNNPRCNNRCPEQCRPWTSRVHSDSTLRLDGDVRELGAENNRSTFCWSSETCHESCQSSELVGLPLGPNGGCCSPQCAGGCYLEDRSDQCIACRQVSQDNKCVSQCDHFLYEYKGKCINETSCTTMVEEIQQNQCGRSIDYSSLALKAVRLSGEKYGRCQTTCAPGHEEDPQNKHLCKPCDKGKCRKVCTPPHSSEKPFMVTNLNTMKELSGCNVYNGSLEISLNGGKNVLPELEEAFKELEEISGYLKITRSYPILTLGFLPKLRSINGSYLDRGQYSLIIIDNPNLQELFSFNVSSNSPKPLKISGGKIFVHLNPKLCPHKIDNLKNYAIVADWDESDVSPHTNGDKEACNTEKLAVWFLLGSAKVAMIRFENFAAQMDDPRSLLYYLINYREVSSGNVTMFDGRDGCNSQNDLWETQEEAPIYSSSLSNRSQEYQEAVINVKPATRYALYVKTYTILAGTKGALSDIIYFETAPDTPSMPRDLQSSAIGHDSVIVSWLPPIRPNGKIERYLVAVTRTPDFDDIQNIDICDSIHSRDKITSTLTKEEPNISAMSGATPPADTSQVETNAPSCTKPSDQSALSLEVITFQDNIIDIIYLKQTCPSSTNSNKSVKRKRSINYELKDSELEGKLTIDGKSHDRVSPEAAAKVGVNVSKLANSYDIKYDRGQEKTKVTIDAGPWNRDNRLTAFINDLEHYSLYRVEILACHGEFVSRGSNPLASYQKCSLQAITHVRTHPIEAYDKVQRSSMVFHPANETVAENVITWSAPERPNGIVLAYRVRYRPKNGHPELWTEGCVNTTTFNRDGGFVLSSTSPGNYLFSVQTVSLYAGQRIWSEELEFEIPRNYIISPIIALMLLMAIIVLIFLAIFSGTYYYRMKKHHVVDYASVNPDYINYKPDEWEVDRGNLILGSQIGTGSFGMVYKGELISEKGKHHCAIKTVPPTSTTKQRMDFLREASIMKEFDTYHVVKLMGVVSISTPVYVIMEFMEMGDLKNFLQKQRSVYEKENKPLVDGVYLMAAQIADGMAYLASKKFVHRDLAARNCMVGENRVVKVGDFGLTRDIYANDYYRRDTQGQRLPVRWMAPESLGDNLYTSASDVWSYGVVVWEIVTFSAYPYGGLSNDEVLKKVQQGYSLSRPEKCPDKLFNLMERCWRRNYQSRPTFNEIVEYLLPETEGKLYPNCFYRKQKTEGDSIAQSMPEEHSNTGAESYPLLSWPTNRANGLTNGVNHLQSDSEDRDI